MPRSALHLLYGGYNQRAKPPRRGWSGTFGCWYELSKVSHRSPKALTTLQRRRRRNAQWGHEVSYAPLTKLTFRLGKQVMNNSTGAREKTKQTKTSPADVIMWSGCKDSQTVNTNPADRADLLECRYVRSWKGHWSDVLCESLIQTM
jgi:hypothetical protein